MLNSVGPTELLLLFVIALLILGPERLPRVASQVGRWVGRARRTANQLRHQLEREIALTEINKPPRKSPPKPKVVPNERTDDGSEPHAPPDSDTAGSSTDTSAAAATDTGRAEDTSAASEPDPRGDASAASQPDAPEDTATASPADKERRPE